MKDHRLIISPRQFDAVIFDMDGVVTQTAKLHAEAWKKTFDPFLEHRSQRSSKSYNPFSIESDYLRYVDGKARYDGVRDFLRSRDIDLPEGTDADGPDQKTIHGLGNRKNSLFQEILREKGAHLYSTTSEFIRKLQRVGIKTAVISASKNAAAVLASAGVDDLFEVRVDGVDAERLDIPGKPAPDIFLAAARKLGVSPQRAVVVEDAQAGVKAGQAGGFALVVHLDRSGHTDVSEESGLVVVKDLVEIGVENAENTRTTSTLPSALLNFADLAARLRDRQPAIFLDYDGTLTPIVQRPEDAIISDQTRRTVQALAEVCSVAIVSGRDRLNVMQLAGIDDIYYAGSHGFDISGPAGKRMEFQQGTEYLPALDKAEHALRQQLAEIEGAQVERKKFAIAVHFRRVAAKQHGEVEKAVDLQLAANDGLRRTGGKMIFELRPDIDWDKGKALSWLLEKLDLARPDVVPMYLGDDLTDEDALREIEESGIGIIVRDEDRPTHASYALEDTTEVQSFLKMLGDFLREKG